MDWKFEDGRIVCKSAPSRPKKITGTRFAAILGHNKWNSEFKTWCEITGVYREPFADTIYTIAGKTIEPKQAKYMEDHYLMEIIRPEDKYGKDFFRATRGDFFGKDPHLGGMWDYLLVEDGKVTGVLEMKTTKRSEDWAEDIPEYYALQAALYAYLLGVQDVYMVCSMLEQEDYEAPEAFEPSVNNTIVRHFKLYERYPTFSALVTYARLWWNTHVEGGVSPQWDEKTDADILKELRKTAIDTTKTERESLIEQANVLMSEISLMKAALKPKEDRLKAITDWMKEQSEEQLNSGFTKVAVQGRDWVWIVSRSITTKLDEDRMKADGIYDKYKTRQTETVRVTVQNKEE